MENLWQLQIFLMKMSGFGYENTLFSGDSGNDIEVLASQVAAVLVANSQPKLRDLAIILANQNGCSDRLYIAKGDFHGMNGNYSAGILEGMSYYFPYTMDWIFSNEIDQTL